MSLVMTTPQEAHTARLRIMQDYGPGGLFGTVLPMMLAASRPGVFSDPSRFITRACASAEVWWVNREMTELIEASAASLPGDFTLEDLRAAGLPDAGFVVLDGEPLGVDAETGERNTVVTALLWGNANLTREMPDGTQQRTMNCLKLAPFTRINFDRTDAYEPPGYDERVAKAATLYATLRSFAGARRETQVLHGVQWLGLGSTDWEPGGTTDAPILGGQGQVLTDAQVRSMAEDRRLLAALWLLANEQLIARPETLVVDRAARRRADRAGVAQPATVRVVTLRRAATESSSPENPAGMPGAPLNRTARWVVAGHWRWQPVGPHRADRRLTWVRPHLKGPEGAPLRARPVVKALVR